jgi:hypothetical protein
MQIRHINLKSTRGILGETNLIRWRTTRHVDRVCLAHQCDDGARIREDARTVVGDARRVDIESSENFCRRLVETQHDLDASVWILRWGEGSTYGTLK